jgi:hypothetical protein
VVFSYESKRRYIDIETFDLNFLHVKNTARGQEKIILKRRMANPGIYGASATTLRV